MSAGRPATVARPPAATHDGLVAYDAERDRAILVRADAAREAGALTRELFLELYLELIDALGDGVERDGIEALSNLAEDDSWIEEAEDRAGRPRGDDACGMIEDSQLDIDGQRASRMCGRRLSGRAARQHDS
jgi:hypothetical protein